MGRLTRTDVVIVGAGQAGLAASYCLSAHGIEHVVLERGRVAERWRSERWPSLTLLTPNWLSRLPGYHYEGPDPDGYMAVTEVVDFLQGYARRAAAPIESGTLVERVEALGDGYLVSSSRGAFRCTNVMIATGYSDLPLVPRLAASLPARIVQLSPGQYRGPDALPEGGVVVVGAAASGVQLADEIQASGRQVTLAVGRHMRLPRMYRGRDILWWLEAMGVLDERTDQVANLEVSRKQPSLQLVGRPDHSTLDLALLAGRGVRVVGRLLAADAGRLHLDDDLMATVAAADVKLASLLGRIEAFAARASLGPLPPAGPFVPYWPLFTGAPTTLDLEAERVGTVIWATGFRRDYRWLKVPVLDAHGELVHEAGVTRAPGLYVLGLQFQRRRKSAFLDGVGDDAAVVTGKIAERVGAGAARVPTAPVPSPISGMANS